MGVQVNLDFEETLLNFKSIITNWHSTIVEIKEWGMGMGMKREEGGKRKREMEGWNG
jgi:hypothetical protein